MGLFLGVFIAGAAGFGFAASGVYSRLGFRDNGLRVHAVSWGLLYGTVWSATNTCRFDDVPSQGGSFASHLDQDCGLITFVERCELWSPR